MNRLRTALFGGSFNPIHLGHTALAASVLRQGLADEVWLMVSPHNPLKAAAGLLAENLRLRLAQQALRDVPGVCASDFEFHLPRPSYTWQTLSALRRSYPRRDFSLLIGADNWLIFDKWAHYAEILRSTPILVYPRPGFPVDASTLPPSVRLVSAPLFPFSSTDVRRAVLSGRDIGAMVSPAIADDVKRLYAAPI